MATARNSLFLIYLGCFLASAAPNNFLVDGGFTNSPFGTTYPDIYIGPLYSEAAWTVTTTNAGTDTLSGGGIRIRQNPANAPSDPYTSTYPTGGGDNYALFTSDFNTNTLS